MSLDALEANPRQLRQATTALLRVSHRPVHGESLTQPRETVVAVVHDVDNSADPALGTRNLRTPRFLVRRVDDLAPRRLPPRMPVDAGTHEHRDDRPREPSRSRCTRFTAASVSGDFVSATPAEVEVLDAQPEIVNRCDEIAMALCNVRDSQSSPVRLEWILALTVSA